MGNLRGASSPSITCRSVRQTAHAFTRTSTCPSPGSGFGTSVNSSGLVSMRAGERRMQAFISRTRLCLVQDDKRRLVQHSNLRSNDNSWPPFRPEPRTAPNVAVSTGAPRFRDALHRLGGGLVMGTDSSRGVAGQLGLCIPSLHARHAPAQRSDPQLFAVPLLRLSPLAAVSRDCSSVGIFAAGEH